MKALQNNSLTLPISNLIATISIRAICTGCVWISPNHFKQNFHDNGETYSLDARLRSLSDRCPFL
jgi:hypothetical protein